MRLVETINDLPDDAKVYLEIVHLLGTVGLQDDSEPKTRPFRIIRQLIDEGWELHDVKGDYQVLPEFLPDRGELIVVGGAFLEVCVVGRAGVWEEAGFEVVVVREISLNFEDCGYSRTDDEWPF